MNTTYLKPDYALAVNTVKDITTVEEWNEKREELKELVPLKVIYWLDCSRILTGILKKNNPKHFREQREKLRMLRQEGRQA